MDEQLKTELSILKSLGFLEYKPLLWLKSESIGTIFFDYRQNITRKTYAINHKGEKLHKKEFESYILFKMALEKKNKEKKRRLDDFSLSQEIDEWLKDCKKKEWKSTIENRAIFLLEECKKKNDQ